MPGRSQCHACVLLFCLVFATRSPCSANLRTSPQTLQMYRFQAEVRGFAHLCKLAPWVEGPAAVAKPLRLANLPNVLSGRVPKTQVARPTNCWQSWPRARAPKRQGGHALSQAGPAILTNTVLRTNALKLSGFHTTGLPHFQFTAFSSFLLEI